MVDKWSKEIDMHGITKGDLLLFYLKEIKDELKELRKVLMAIQRSI